MIKTETECMHDQRWTAILARDQDETKRGRRMGQRRGYTVSYCSALVHKGRHGHDSRRELGRTFTGHTWD